MVGGVFGLGGGCIFVGNSILSDEVCTSLSKRPQAVEAIGDDLECSLDWGATMADSRYDYFHYRVIGSRGSGVAIVHSEATGPDATEEIVDGVLEVGGRRIPLE